MMQQKDSEQTKSKQNIYVTERNYFLAPNFFKKWIRILKFRCIIIDSIISCDTMLKLPFCELQNPFFLLLRTYYYYKNDDAVTYVCRDLVKILGSTKQEDRYKIPIRYEQMFEKDLYDLIKSECGRRPFGKTLQLLAVNPLVA